MSAQATLTSIMVHVPYARLLCPTVSDVQAQLSALPAQLDLQSASRIQVVLVAEHSSPAAWNAQVPVSAPLATLLQVSRFQVQSVLAALVHSWEVAPVISAQQQCPTAKAVLTQQRAILVLQDSLSTVMHRTALVAVQQSLDASTVRIRIVAPSVTPRLIFLYLDQPVSVPVVTTSAAPLAHCVRQASPTA